MRLRTGLRHLFFDLNVGIGSKMGLNAGHKNYFPIFCAPESDPMFFPVEPSSSSTYYLSFSETWISDLTINCRQQRGVCFLKIGALFAS